MKKYFCDFCNKEVSRENQLTEKSYVEYINKDDKIHREVHRYDMCEECCGNLKEKLISCQDKFIQEMLYNETFLEITKSNVWDYADGRDFFHIGSTSVCGNQTREEYLNGSAIPKTNYRYYRLIGEVKSYFRIGEYIRL